MKVLYVKWETLVGRIKMRTRIMTFVIYAVGSWKCREAALSILQEMVTCWTRFIPLQGFEGQVRGSLQVPRRVVVTEQDARTELQNIRTGYGTAKTLLAIVPEALPIAGSVHMHELAQFERGMASTFAVHLEMHHARVCARCQNQWSCARLRPDCQWRCINVAVAEATSTTVGSDCRDWYKSH